MIHLNPNAHTYVNPETGETYLTGATKVLAALATDIADIPLFRATALDTEQYALTDALDVLTASYLDALAELPTGDHSALQAAMEALRHAVSEVMFHFAQ